MKVEKIIEVASKLFNKYQDEGHVVLTEWDNKEDTDLFGIYNPIYCDDDLSKFPPDYVVCKSHDGDTYGYMIGYTSGGGYDEQPIFDYQDYWKNKHDKPFLNPYSAMVALVEVVVLNDILLSAHIEEEIAEYEEDHGI